MSTKKIVQAKVTISFDIEADAAKLQNMSAEQLLKKKLSVPNIQFNNVFLTKAEKKIRYGVRWQNLVQRLGYKAWPDYNNKLFKFCSTGIYKSLYSIKNNQHYAISITFQVDRKTGDIYIVRINPTLTWWLANLEMDPETKTLITNIGINLPYKIGYYNFETTLKDINYLVDMLNNGVLCLKKQQQQ